LPARPHLALPEPVAHTMRAARHLARRLALQQQQRQQQVRLVALL
jgi:hypothetical protein